MHIAQHGIHRSYIFCTLHCIVIIMIVISKPIKYKNCTTNIGVCVCGMKMLCVHTGKYSEILMLKYIKFMYKLWMLTGMGWWGTFVWFLMQKLCAKKSSHDEAKHHTLIKGQKVSLHVASSRWNFFQQLIMFACFNSHQREISDIWFTFWYFPSTMTSIWL
jgi:hypothetical protein